MSLHPAARGRLESLLNRTAMGWLVGVAILFLAIRGLSPGAFVAAAASAGAAGGGGAREVAAGLGGSALSVAWFALLNAAAWRWGRRLMRIFRMARVEAAESVLAILLGWMLLSSLLFALAACGLALIPVMGSVGALAGAAGLADLAMGEGRRRCGSPQVRDARWRVRLGMKLLLAGILALTALLAMAPQVEIDSLIHNLPLAARLLALGNLVPMLGNGAFHLPAASEMLRAWAMSLGGERAGGLWGPLANGLTAALIVSWLQRRLGDGWAWLGGCLYCVNIFVISLAATAKPDVLLAPLGTAALIVLESGRGGPAARRLLVAGLMLGTAAAVKYTAGGAALAVFIALAIRGPFSRAVLLGMGAALPLLPWLAKSLLIAGNPVYPFGYGLWGGLGMSEGTYRNMLWIAGNALHEGAYGSWGARLGALWNMTFREGVAPVWLALLPFSLLAAWRRGRGGMWGPAILISLLIWSAGPVQFRYLFAVLPAIVLTGVAGLGRSGMRGAAYAGGAILALQAVQLAGDSGLGARLPAGAALEGRADFLRRNIPASAEAIDAIAALKPAGRIACVGHDAAYPRPDILLTPSVYFPPPFYAAALSASDAGEFGKKLRQMRITHVLYNPIHAAFNRRFQAEHPWKVRDVAVYADFWRKAAREEFRSGTMTTQHGFFLIYSLEGKGTGNEESAFLPGLEAILAGIEQRAKEAGGEAARGELTRLDGLLGRFGQYLYWRTLFEPPAEDSVRLMMLERAAETGFWDISLFRNMEETARRAGRPESAREAARRLKELAPAE